MEIHMLKVLCNSPINRDTDNVSQDTRVAETMFSKIFGERNSTKTSKYYF